jgi:hypothetical protein
MSAIDVLDPLAGGIKPPPVSRPPPKRTAPQKKSTPAAVVDPFDIGDGAAAIDALGHQGSPGDPDSLREEDKKISDATADAKFRVIESSEFLTGESTEPEWQIEEFVPKIGIGLTYGPSKSFKSFGVIPKAYAIHSGTQWHDRTTRKGRAVIIVCEGLQGYRNRLLAHSKLHSIDKADMPAIIKVAPNLFQGRDDLEALIRSLCKKGATYVVIDTQNHVMVGGDESSTKDMNIVYGAFAEIARRVGCFIEIISHTGHGDQSHARGSSVQRPAVDVEIYHERIDGEMTCRAIVRKLKDGDDCEVSFTYGLNFVPLGTYAKSGKPYGSLAVATIEDSAPRPVATKVSKHDATVLEVFDSFKTRQVQLLDLYRAIEKKLPRGSGKRDRRDCTAKTAVTAILDRGGVLELVQDGNAVQRRVVESTPQNDPFIEKPIEIPLVTNLGAAAASLANKRKLDK